MDETPDPEQPIPDVQAEFIENMLRAEPTGMHEAFGLCRHDRARRLPIRCRLGQDARGSRP